MVWTTTNQQENERSRDAPASDPNEDLEDSLEFFVKTMDPRVGSGAPHRYKEHTTTDVVRTSGSQPTSHGHHDALELVDVGNEHVDDADELDEISDEDGSLTGEELEAIFLRNLKRHEILSAFQRSGTKTPDAGGSHTQPLSSTRWEQLQQLLEKVPADVQAQRYAGRPHLDEPSLVASSRWLPSSAM
ncbi:hypothetical protein PINS_up006967 [Pythium insidiosum]|nr:hypothetical protein PINS_up006967 [Pythium insidiosum]